MANYEDMGIKYIKLCSDSQATIKALHNTHIKSKCVANALEAMETLARKNKTVQLVWVKAHVNIEGNEEADKVAKEGATKGDTNKKILIPSPWSDTK